MTVRPRTRADVPRLAATLREVHVAEGYPYVMPRKPGSWIAGPGDLAAFVESAVEPGNGDVPVGHVSVQAAADVDHGAGSTLHHAWSTGHGRPIDACAVVSRLFVAPTRSGRGIGTALLTAAVDWMRDHDLAPCLDVFPIGSGSDVQRWYERQGWVVVGEASPQWRQPGWPPLVAMILPG